MSLLSELEAWTMAGAGQVVDRPDIPLHKSAPPFDLRKALGWWLAQILSLVTPWVSSTPTGGMTSARSSPG